MSISLKDKPKIYSQVDVKCKNKCGFYGNPEWQGYCSKCHKELHQQQKPEWSSKVSKKVHRSHSDVQESSVNLGFGKFEEKKKQQAEKRSKTIKSIIKRGHTLKETSSQSPSKDLFDANEILQLCRDEQVKDVVGKDIVKQMRTFSDVINKYDGKQQPIDEQSEAMQDFYNFMFNRCETHPSYLDLSPEQIDSLMDEMEKQFMTRLYRSSFQQISTEYEEKDLILQNRIRSLNWVTSQHLYLNITDSNPDVRELIDKAMTDVLQVDSEPIPQGKISCIVNCSKNIFQILNLCSGGGAASADEFLPAMVYIILRANPTRLQSNIKYITNYSIPARLRSGEGAYYFTNLCCAVAFIEDLNYESLDINEDEFERYMAGEIPLQHGRQDLSDSEGVRVMTQNHHTLTQIQESNNKVLNDICVLKEDIMRFHETLQKCRSAPPLVLNPTPYTAPANTDMSFIPEILRSRVVFAPAEDILVEIDTKTYDSPPIVPHANGELISLCPIQTEQESSSPLFNGSNPPTHLHLSSNAYLASLQSLKVELPNPLRDSSPRDDFLSLSGINQAVASIQGLEYPTELFPEDKSDESSVEFGPFEGCDSADLPTESAKILDPLSPESEFVGESLNLPSPLQPIVVQSMNLQHDKD